MKRRFATSSIWAGLLLAFAVSAEPADVVFVGDRIVTMDPQTAGAEVVAVDDGKIVWMGSAAAAADWLEDAEEVIELGGRALLPGFIDAHGHLTFSGVMTRWANVASPPVGPAVDMASLQQTLTAYIQQGEIAAGDWVIGGGYDDSLLAERRHPTRHDLDAVSTKHPIALLHVSGHLAAANTSALQLAGITRYSPDPPGGHIRREPDGQPSGVLEETAQYGLRGYMFPSAGDPRDDVLAALDRYASFGITTAQDGAASPQSVALLAAMAEQGQLAMDVTLYPVARTEAEIPFDAALAGVYRNRLKIAGVKMILDGSPQGKTAYLTKPYRVPPTGQGPAYRGYPTFEQDYVDRQIKFFSDARIPMIVHANGDAAADMLIGALERAVPEHDHRTVMIHAQTVREDQLDRMDALGMIPSFFSAHTFYWGDWHRDSVFGVERASRISPTHSTVQRGMVFTTHNDAPIVPPDMMRLLWATTNRVTRSGQVLGEQQRVGIYEALQSVTTHAAYQLFEEDSKGSLTVGKQADLVILSRNPLETPAAELLDVEVDSTYAHGRRIFRRN